MACNNDNDELFSSLSVDDSGAISKTKLSDVYGTLYAEPNTEHPKRFGKNRRNKELQDVSSTSYANNELLTNPGPARSGHGNPDLHAEWRIRSTSLFEYMEDHISAVEDEAGLLSKSYALIQSKQLDENSTAAVSEINQSTFMKMYRLKQLVHGLCHTLETNCAELDSLIEGASSEEARGFFGENALRQEVFKCRLGYCLEELNKLTNVVRQRIDDLIDGVRQVSKPSKSVVLGRAPVDCITWVHGSLFVALLGTILYMYLWSGASDQWIVYLRLIRSPLFVVLLLYLYGINMKVWATFDIDYGAILNNHRNAIPTPNYAFKIAGILTVVFSVMTFSLILASPFSVKLPIKIISLAMWFVLLAFLTNPFSFFLRKARYNFILIIIHIILSPFVFVYFSDFLLADQFNSLVSIFLDIEYLICYFTADSWSGHRIDSKICMIGVSANIIRPVVSSLPALWRFLQCLRCYYDSRKFRHLLNAVKYFTTFPVIIFATLFGIHILKIQEDNLNFSHELGWVFICLLIFSFIHAIYTFLWDVSSDWGILDVTRCNAFQRELAYRYMFLYGFAIVFDLILRFLWALKLSLAIYSQGDSDMIYTGLAIAEIFRRFIWNFFRVEYAHILAQ